MRPTSHQHVKATTLSALQSPDRCPVVFENAFAHALLPAWRGVERRWDADIAQDALTATVLRSRRLGVPGTIRFFNDEVSAAERYVFVSARNAAYRSNLREAHQPAPLSTVTSDDSVAEWLSSSDAPNPLEEVGMQDALERLWNGATLLERRTLLLALAKHATGHSVSAMRMRRVLLDACADPRVLRLVQECFGSADVSSLDPSRWGRGARPVSWSAGTVGSALAEAERLIRDCLEVSERAATRRARTSRADAP